MQVGRLMAGSVPGRLMVELDGNARGPLPARTVMALDQRALDEAIAVRRTAVLLLTGDPGLPIVVGLVAAEPGASLLGALLAPAAGAAPAPAVPATSVEPAPSATPVEAHVDGKRVTIEGAEEIVLKCGQASITLRRNGKVILAAPTSRRTPAASTASRAAASRSTEIAGVGPRPEGGHGDLSHDRARRDQALTTNRDLPHDLFPQFAKSSPVLTALWVLGVQGYSPAWLRLFCRQASLTLSSTTPVLCPPGGRVSCLHHLFEREVDLHPESPAIVCGDAAMSYAQVEERANQLARHLRSHGVGTGGIVGLMVERSPDAILAILSILKAGAAYCRRTLASARAHSPHPGRGLDHHRGQRGQAGADALGVLDAAGASVVAIDDPCQPWPALSTMRLSVEQTGVAPSDLCYVLYTSGLTGRPKGVMTEHRNVVRFATAFNEVIPVRLQDRVFQGFSLGFDGSVEEIWMAFRTGQR